MRGRLTRIEDWELLANQADFNPETLAALCSVSLRQLERHFLLRFQKTPRAWMREIKCRLAIDLLLQGYSNKAVISELRYADQSTFCHQFKAVCGMSPQTFVQEIRVGQIVAARQKCRAAAIVGG